MQNLLPYDKSQLTPGIAHIGLGNFHRSHQAFYMHQLLKLNFDENKQWGITEIEMRNEALVEKMNSQGCTYTLITRDASGSDTEVIGSIISATINGPDAYRVLQSQDIKIISCTVTEQGYCQDRNSPNKIDLQLSEIQHDLQDPEHPISSIGLITYALKYRFENQMQGITVLSCDNVQGNGHILQSLVLDYSSRLSADLSTWISSNISFPNSMVDRITPAFNPEYQEYIQQTLGYHDECPVMGEKFVQWVIEDNFKAGRPNWEAVDAILVDDVMPYELLKLRLLNCAHLTLGNLAALNDVQYIPDAMRLEFMNSHVENYQASVFRTLLSSQIDPEDYADQVRERFANPAVKDTVERIQMDIHSKIYQFLRPSLIDIRRQNFDFKRVAVVVALWVRVSTGVSESGVEFPLNDVRFEEMRDKAKRALEGHGLREFVVSGLGEEFGNWDEFLDEVKEDLKILQERGSRDLVLL